MTYMTPIKYRKLPSVFNSDAFSFFDTFFEDGRWSPKVYTSQNKSMPFDLNRVKDKDGNPIALEFKFALAGYSKDDVKVELDDGILSVSAEKVEESDSNKTELYRGISKKSFKQSYQLTDLDLDTSNISADMKNGQLKIVLPYLKKIEESRKTLIEVK